MSENYSGELGQIYGINSGMSMFNCENLTAGNCSYMDPNDFYGVTPLDPADEDRLQSIIRIVVPIFFGIIFIVGLVGNLLVVIVVSANQQMRSTTNLLILNLAIADLLFTIFCVPFSACDYITSSWPFGDAWCKIVQYMIVVTAYTSVYTLVLMSFDRYLAVVHPFTSISFRTEKNAIYSIIITWLVIVILSSPVLTIHGEMTYFHRSERRTSCLLLQNDYNIMVFHVTFFATSYVIPLALICSLYLRMLIRLWSGAVPGGHVSAEGRRGRKRATRMVVVVVAIFAFCWCPIQVILLIKSLKYYRTTFTTVLIQILSQVLGYMNSCVNPVLYAFLSDNFRKAFRKVIYTGQSNERNHVANPTSVKHHNGHDRSTVTTKTSKVNEQEMNNENKEDNAGGQGPLKCWERFVNSILCASNEPNVPKKSWRRKCVDCLKPTEDAPEQGTADLPKRETWGSRCTFFMTTLGMSVGLGQVWRFPVLAYSYGGGVFLLLYGFFLFTYGNAIFFFEVINGQYTSKNPLKVFDKVPLFIGTGWCMIMYAFLFCTYYNHMVSFSFLYLFNTFTSRLPWSFCPENENEHFDTVTCMPLPKLRDPKIDGIVCGNYGFTYNRTELCANSTYALDQRSICCFEAKVEGSLCEKIFNVTNLCREREFPSSYYWTHSVTKSFREDDPMYGYLGEENWALLGCSFLAWFVAYAALYKGIKSLGVIMYIIVPLPYIVLFIMFGIAIPQEGAMDGLKSFFIPEASAFFNPNVWRVASEQAFYSVGVAMGPLITFGSYSKFDSPSHVDCALICLCIFLTSLVSGSVVFSVLGFLAKKSGRAFSKVVLPGPGLVFIVYPEALDLLPGAAFFCFLFYLMLINLGLSSVTGIIETVPSAVYDIWPITRKFKYLVNLAVLFFAFLLGLPITYRGGLNYYNSFDTFSAGMTLLPICILEMFVVVYIYGIGRFCEDINFMLGFYPNRFYRWQWLVGPFSLLIIFLYGIATLSLPPMRLWQTLLGSFLFCLVMMWIPVGMVYVLVKYGRKKNLKNVLKSPPDHGPKNPEKFEARKDFSVKRKIF